MRTFQISEELRERHGYPKLTKELRAKILGLNGAAALRGGAEHRRRASSPGRSWRRSGARSRGANAALGPTTMAAVQAFRDDDRELWASTATMLA